MTSRPGAPPEEQGRGGAEVRGIRRLEAILEAGREAGGGAGVGPGLSSRMSRQLLPSGG